MDPLEATIASSYYDVTGVNARQIPKSQVPIGTACDGEELLVLDEKMAPVPDREIGDLYIAGKGLSPGYWSRSGEDGWGIYSRQSKRTFAPPISHRRPYMA